MTNSTHIRRRKRREGRPSFALRLLLTVPTVVAFIWAQRLSITHLTLAERYSLILAMLSITYLQTLFHELGHVVAGLAVGFHFVHISVGPIQLRQQNGQLRLSWVRIKNFGFGGTAGVYPVSTENLPHRYAVFVVGGPLAGLGFAAVSYIAYIVIPQQSMWWDSVLVFSTIYALLKSLFNLIPLHYAGIRMDGAYLLSALRGNDKDHHLFAYLALVAAMCQGIRPRRWDPSLVMRSPLPGQRSVDILHIDIMKCYYAWDCGEIVEAGRYFDKVMERGEDYPLANRKALYYEAAYFWARHRGDVAQANKWLASEGTEVMPERYYQPAVDAAIAYAEGKAGMAIKKAKQAIELLEESPFLGTAKMMRDDLEQLIADAQRSSKRPLELGAQTS